MNININDYDLFIFDLDDTLINTEYYHYIIWLEILRNFINNNFYFDFKFFCSKFHSNKINGIKDYIINELNFNLNMFELIINTKNERFLNFIKTESHNIKLIEGAENYIKHLLDNNKKFIIVTNSSKNILEFYLELFPILQKSTKNYYIEIFKIRKPSPDCYLHVIKDFPKDKKIAFEDSITGIHALSQTNNNIDIVFINNENYYYYDQIITKYKIKKNIKNYLNLF
jgi:beta-phosphoglucomutase-like phosphatase (HAD superfamily)